MSGLRVWRGLLAVLLGVGVLTGSVSPAGATSNDTNTTNPTNTTNNSSSVVGGTSPGPNSPVVTSVRYDGGGDTPISQTVDGVNDWFSHDPLGTVTDLVSSAGVLVRAQDFTPYGLSRAPPGAPTPPVGTPAFVLSFTNSLSDADGTNYMRARQYNPQFGQFNTRDPLGQNGSAMWGGGYGSHYNYVNGQTTLLTDPSGLCLWQKNVSCLDLAQDVGKDVGYSTVMTFAAVGRGATGGLTDLAADTISEGASCTVDHTTGQAKTGEFLGTAAAVLTGGWSGFRGAKNITALRTRTTQTTLTQHAATKGGSGAADHAIPIGEDMTNRVEPFAERVGADTYKPDMSAPRDQWMENNRTWINDRMDEGCTILDCGAAPGRANYPNATSPYYQMELDEIAKRGYTNIVRVWLGD